jgi:uncharacterized protein with beta-barrel porin domain
VAGGGSVTVNAGGTFAPGGSVGTMSVGGDYNQNAGSTLQVEVSKTAGGGITNDVIAATGGATLDDASTIEVTEIAAGGIIATGDAFTIITTGTGVGINNGPTINSMSAFLSFSGALANGGLDYQLLATRLGAFAPQAVGANNQAVAAALDNDMNFAVGDYITVFNALMACNAGQFNAAAHQMSPEMYAGVANAGNWATRQMSGQMAGYLGARRAGTPGAGMMNSAFPDRPRLVADVSSDPTLLAAMIAQIEETPTDGDADKAGEAPAPMPGPADTGWNFFAKPFGVFHNQESTSTLTGFGANAVGLLIGVDRPLGDGVIGGLSFGYAHTELDFHHGRGGGDIETFRFGPYATVYRDGFFVDTSVTYGFHLNEVERRVAILDIISAKPRGKFQAHDFTIYLGGGYELDLGCVEVTPTASIEYIHYRHEGFHEHGGGPVSLAVEAKTSRSLRSKLGVNVSHLFEVGQAKVVPEVFGGWAHEFIDEHSLNARFGAGVTPYGIDVKQPHNDSAYFGAAVTVLLDERTSVFVRYEGELSSDTRTNSVAGGLAIDL